MLIQHLLTERIFRRVFDNPDFVSRNVIAREIEEVARALTSQRFSRRDFFRPLDRFLRRNRNDGRHDQRLFGEAGLSQHRLRAVFPGFFGRGCGHARHRLHAAGDRRFHGAFGGGAAAARVWSLISRFRRASAGPVRGHGQLYSAGHAPPGGDRAAGQPAAQVRVRTALQRGDAAALLHRGDEH